MLRRTVDGMRVGAVAMGTEREGKGGGTGTAAARFLRAATLCRIRDVEQLLAVGALVGDLCALIHALQKERGASSIYLGSGGSRFAEDRVMRAAESQALETVLRGRLDLVDERLGRLGSGAQFYNRVAIALHAMDGLPALRRQVASLALVPQDSVKSFTDVIGHLLAVVFEAADIAADPEISQALVALFNLVQGKEFAGQERATAGAGFSRGRFDGAEHARLLHLIAAQNRAFRIVAEFADPAHDAALRAALADAVVAEVERMRGVALGEDSRDGGLPGVTAEGWFDAATRRMDLMKSVEDRLTADLRGLCEAKLAQARADLEQADLEQADLEQADLEQAAAAGPDAVLPVAMVLAMQLIDADPAAPQDAGQPGNHVSGLYASDGLRPKLMRSVLDVVQAQSQRLRDVSLELETAKAALNERKVIDRAKGLLMSTRNLSEEEAYKLIRKTAMNQNKRIVEVAEAILSMSDILRGVTAGGA
ncbi:nitrate regulatory protein [Azospirillum picis]|uniref:Uncharacterized protein YjbI with pentapeptide repeats n=1 Tax=Azospirillum picis TaxID=488438 RepID=A0ABU0MHH4_9PROT|nr:nitrate regulatory protein [Azospirillum picis]MBP2298985.1 uncharacterized protein YjbI with pentapeptide repeats [Azospirillum picis]MDQ0532773.1 uncharacterized protein YjbI with pentapeptide repeats [Azospirillum picis]